MITNIKVAALQIFKNRVYFSLKIQNEIKKILPKIQLKDVGWRKTRLTFSFCMHDNVERALLFVCFSAVYFQHILLSEYIYIYIYKRKKIDFWQPSHRIPSRVINIQGISY